MGWFTIGRAPWVGSVRRGRIDWGRVPREEGVGRGFRPKGCIFGTGLRGLGLLASLAVLASAALGSEGTWILMERAYIPSRDERSDSCSSPWGLATASVFADGDQVHGRGQARDASLFCEVRSVAVAAGLRDQVWFYVGPGEGRARAYARVQIRGMARLEDVDAASAALGYCQFRSSVTPTIRAVLTESAAETTDRTLGTLHAAFEGLWGAFPVSIGSGEGEYPDEDVQSTYGEDCGSSFFFSKSSRGLIHAYAKAGLIDDWAAANADLDGRIEMTLHLTGCPCPGPSPAPTPRGTPGPSGFTPGRSTPGGGVTPPGSPSGGTTPRVPRPGEGGPDPDGEP